MDFQTAVRTCFQKYATFSGRAHRPEFWWFVLFLVGVSIALQIVDGLVFGFGPSDGTPLSLIFSLATLLPALAAGARRLHDIGKSAWWLLLALIPIIGTIILIYWHVQPGQDGTNEYG